MLSQLYLALRGVVVPQDVLRNLPGHVRAGAVELGGVFPTESAAAVPRRAAVGVTHQLPAGDAGVCEGAAGDESTGGVDQHTKVLVQTVRVRHLQHDVPAKVVHVLRVYVLAMLCADEECVDALFPVVVSDLGLCVFPQGGVPGQIQTLDGVGRQHEGHRQHVPGHGQNSRSYLQQPENHTLSLLKTSHLQEEQLQKGEYLHR